MPAPRTEAELLQGRVDFTKPLRAWDGFGLNYVETCQTRDYAGQPQDYGGFSVLKAEDRQKVIELAFGPEGLRPGVIKMFLDCWHQPAEPPEGSLNELKIDPRQYDHERTTKWMREFVKAGVAKLRAQKIEPQVIVTLYGPPAFMTRQKLVRGRDLDPRYRVALAKYLAAWAKHLREVEQIPVRWVSLHNEGEDWVRWPHDGKSAGDAKHDYNLFWPPEQVVEMVKLTRQVLDANGLQEVGVTPGETTNWLRFERWGYAAALAEDAEAVKALGLITSHGFEGGLWAANKVGTVQRWAGDWRSAGTDLLREKKPELHAWVTSTSWRNMDAGFVWEIMQNLYSAKNNAIIPWACIQRSSLWAGGDPNPGTAFRVHEDGRLTIERGYHFYRQVCLAGRPGTAVCQASINSTRCGVIGFAGGQSGNRSAAVLINAGESKRELTLHLRGGANRWRLIRTSPTELGVEAGEVELKEGAVRLSAPAGSVTTLLEAR